MTYALDRFGNLLFLIRLRITAVFSAQRDSPFKSYMGELAMRAFSAFDWDETGFLKIGNQCFDLSWQI